jgi:hypothetical protein
MIMTKHYVLDGQKPVRVDDPAQWAEWMRDSIQDRLIGQNVVNGIMVRTVFTGIDLESHRGRPRLFESYAWRIGSDAPHRTEHYCSWKSAVAGHQNMVERVSSEPAEAKAA